MLTLRTSPRWSQYAAACSRRRRTDTRNSLRTRMVESSTSVALGRRQVRFSRLGDILAMLGDYSKAEEFYRQGIDLPALQRSPAGPMPADPTPDDYRRDLVRSHLGLAVLFKDLQRYKEAQDAVSRPPAPTMNLSLPRPTRSITSGGRSLPTREGCSWAHEAETSGALATPNSRIAAGSEQAYREALTLQEELAKGQPDRIDMSAKLGRYRNNLSILLNANKGRPLAAETELRAAPRVGQEGSRIAGGTLAVSPDQAQPGGVARPARKIERGAKLAGESGNRAR